MKQSNPKLMALGVTSLTLSFITWAGLQSAPQSAHASIAIPTSCENLETVFAKPIIQEADASIFDLAYRRDRPSELTWCEDDKSVQCLLKKLEADLTYGPAVSGQGVRVNAVQLERMQNFNPAATQAGRTFQRSEMLRDINALRIQARQASGLVPPCEPNLVFIQDHNDEPVLGLGPVYFGGYHFELEGQHFHNFLAIEDSHRSGLTKGLTLDAFVDGNYLTGVVVHEIAHGIMQDLYGIEDFNRVHVENVHSTVGHFASLITDPTMAWIEGFAQGFEAYLGERYYLDRTTLDLENYEGFFRNILGSIESVAEENFFFRVGTTVPLLARSAFNLSQNGDRLVVDFLKLHDQFGIRAGSYFLTDMMRVTGQLLGIVPANPLSATGALSSDRISGDIPETIQALYSKEGAVAWFVYQLLKAGLSQKMFETMAAVKPKDIHAFTEALVERLSSSEITLVRPALIGFFTESGNHLLGASSTEYFNTFTLSEDRRFDTLQEVSETLQSRLGQSHLARGGLNTTPPREIWIEWDAPAKNYHAYGRLHRLNLVASDMSQLSQLVDRIDFSDVNVVTRRSLGTSEMKEIVLQKLLIEVRDSIPDFDHINKFYTALDARVQTLLSDRNNMHQRFVIQATWEQLRSLIVEGRDCFRQTTRMPDGKIKRGCVNFEG